LRLASAWSHPRVGPQGDHGSVPPIT